jgi:hypothetical protein
MVVELEIWLLTGRKEERVGRGLAPLSSEQRMTAVSNR